MILGDDDTCDECGLDPCGCAPTQTIVGQLQTRDDSSAVKFAPSPMPVSVPATDANFEAFRKANPHVLREALRIGRAWLDRGDKYISTKAILEVLRTSVQARKDDGFKINNNYSAPIARWLVDQDRRFATVLRMRTRK